MVVELVELLTNALAHCAHLTVFTVVLEAVLEHEIQIVEEIRELQILICVKLVLYRAKVHRLLNYVEVVRDVELLGIHRFVENPCLMVLPDRSDHTLCGFVPTLIDRLLFIDLGQF